MKGKVKSMKKIAGALCTLMLAAGVLPARAADKAKMDERLSDAADVIHDFVSATPEKAIPQSILAGASCVVVIPSEKKGAFLIGAQYGKGVGTCRTGHGWSAPVFIKLEGASYGLQIGGQSTALVLVGMNNKSLQDMLHAKFKLGADAAAAAGPVGRNAQAGTDWKLNAEFLTYSRSKGLFAGLDLNGDVLSLDEDEMNDAYGPGVHADAVLRGSVPPAPNAQNFVHTVARSFAVSQANH